MPVWKGIILGIVQGLAEFLPISSSGHLVILKEIMHIDLEGGGLFFDVMLHFGTLFAIFVAFRHGILKMIVEGLHIVGASLSQNCSDSLSKVCYVSDRVYDSDRRDRHLI